MKSAQRASRKRHHESEPKQEDKEVSKKAKMKPNLEPEVTTIPAPGNPSPGQLTTLQVKTFSMQLKPCIMVYVTFLTCECPGNVKSWRPCQEGSAIHDLGWLIQVPTAA